MLACFASDWVQPEPSTVFQRAILESQAVDQRPTLRGYCGTRDWTLDRDEDRWPRQGLKQPLRKNERINFMQPFRYFGVLI